MNSWLEVEAKVQFKSASEAFPMPLKQRQAIMKKIEELRNGRALICFFNFDRESNIPVPCVQMNFSANTKEVLFRVLKETFKAGKNVDACLYTRGGDLNAVWPIVSLLREFDRDFNVLVPFRCHSAGTLLAIGAKQIFMTILGEFSPIDPSTGNQFNPPDPNNSKAALAISVEDVQQYKSFISDQLGTGKGDKKTVGKETASQFLKRLTELVHPLALGNVHRVHLQIKQLAEKLLKLHSAKDLDVGHIIEALTTRFYSHLHMISRTEAQEIVGDQKVQFADGELGKALDDLLRTYEDDFELRKPFFMNAYLGDDPAKQARFIAGAIESSACSYLYETNASLRQQSALPSNVQVQIPLGQAMPLLPGFARQYTVDITSQAWIRNKDPKGVTK